MGGLGEVLASNAFWRGRLDAAGMPRPAGRGRWDGLHAVPAAHQSGTDGGSGSPPAIRHEPHLPARALRARVPDLRHHGPADPLAGDRRVVDVVGALLGDGVPGGRARAGRPPLLPVLVRPLRRVLGGARRRADHRRDGDPRRGPGLADARFTRSGSSAPRRSSARRPMGSTSPRLAARRASTPPGSACARRSTPGEPGAGIPAVRARLEALWGARTYDHAGMTEVGAYGFECVAQAGLHVNELEFVAEVLDPESGQPVAPGEVGELTLTNLDRWAAPVLRYRSGDRVRLAAGACACGRTFARLEGGLLGRVDDMLVVRGVNVFPSALEGIVRTLQGGGRVPDRGLPPRASWTRSGSCSRSMAVSARPTSCARRWPGLPRRSGAILASASRWPRCRRGLCRASS